MSCVTVLSARIAERDLSPRWAKVGDPFCAGAALPYQGIARPPVVGAGAGRQLPVRAGAFKGVAIEPPAGAAVDDPSKLTGLSAP